MRAGPAIGVDHRATRPGTQSQPEWIGNAEAALHEAAPQRLSRARNRIVGPGAIHDAIEDLRVLRASAAPPPCNFDTTVPVHESQQLTCMDV